MPTSRPSSLLLAPVLSAALLLAATGCGAQHPDADPTPTFSKATTGATTPIPSVTPTPTPSASQTPTTPAATATATGAAALLLPASRLPGLDPGWGWTEARTGAQKGPLGVCQRFPMRTIGAERTVVRNFFPTGDQTGGTGAQLVSRFVDDKSVSQAIAILQSWHDGCRDRLTAFDHKTIGPVTTVQTPKGTATHYLVRYHKSGAAGAGQDTFEDLGVLRSGTTVELILLKLRARSYPQPGPMPQALANAAELLP